MYSLVLMTALTSGPQTAEFNGFFRDLFHRDGYGCCGGCVGPRYSCSGCCGSCGGGFLGLGLFRWGCGGSCCGGCTGSSYSCYGSSYMGYGGPTYGAPMAVPPPGAPYATPEVAPPLVAPDRLGFRPAGYEAAATPVAAGGPSARATVLVRLPIDARLYADSTALRLTGTERKFVTPELPAGQEYTYRFRAEYERDGEVVSVTKRVAVRSGSTSTLEFADLTVVRPNAGPAATPVSNPNVSVAPAPEPVAAPAAAPAAPTADRATITVKLPPGATLYVDDRKNSAGEPVKEFSTPPLPAGREFAYLLKAEVVRDGRPESLIQKVPFRAGERITVDFTAGR